MCFFVNQDDDIRLCSHYLFPVVATGVEQVVITKVGDGIEVLPIRLILTSCNELCACRQLIKNLLIRHNKKDGGMSI